MTPSAVSKLVARLETRLGTRLVNRSTRKLQLTPEGCAFYERSVSILADIAEAERYASSGEQRDGPDPHQYQRLVRQPCSGAPAARIPRACTQPSRSTSPTPTRWSICWKTAPTSPSGPGR
jgi:DNA-binding transcriptional LysR family regulator